MADTTTSMIFRIEPELKKAFERTAADLDLTASQLLRRLVRDTVEHHAQKHAQRVLNLTPASPPAPAPKKPTTAPQTGFQRHGKKRKS
jgi:hypothetical protein